MLKYKKVEQKRIGLNNNGNNCFFNSVLQFMNNCTVLNKYISSNDISGEFVNIYKNFLSNYHDSDSNHCINPSKITRYVSNILGRRYNTQEDADMYLSYMIDRLIDEILSDIKQKKIEDNCITSLNIRLEDFINTLFTIRIKKNIKCSVCNHESISDDNVNKLYLCITKSDNLYDLISDYSYDILDDDNKYKCEKCKKKVNAIISRTIESTPKYLFITLKRYDNNNRKINKEINMPESINIGSNYEYKLRGVIYHMGSTSGGHYVYYGKTEYGLYEYNDSTVRSVSEKEFNDVKKNGYIYLYAINKNLKKD